MYQALYRKWRPQTFDDVVGQDHITTTLKNQVASGRLSHAYLFVGTRGTGKTTCAKILARAVNCEDPVDGNPCNECASCRGILDGSILDVVELDAASNNSVDDVRSLQDEAIFSPATVRKRVYIIDEVHMLSTAAFNALLKILEEPPEHLMFILCTTELHKVLPTIISRCQRHSFRRISPSVIASRLKYVAQNEDIDLSDDAAMLLSRMADGGMRDALSLLDQCSADPHIDIETIHLSLGLAGNRRIESLCESLFAENTEASLKSFNDMWRDGKDPAGILDELGDLIRDILIEKTAPSGGGDLLSGRFDDPFIRKLSSSVPAAELFDALRSIQNTDLSGSNPRRAAEMCLVSISDHETGSTFSALNKRISTLENMMRGQSSLPPQPVLQQPAFTVSHETRSEMTIDEDIVPASEKAGPITDSSAGSPRISESQQEISPGNQTSETDMGQLWTELVEKLSGKIDMSSYAFLKAHHQFSLHISGDEMTIQVSVPFVRSMLDTPAHITVISRTASEILGRNIRVRFTDGSETEFTGPDHRKLDVLREFPIVKFE